jgi:hypothetical protein
MSIYDQANDAFERGEMEGVKEILAPNASLVIPKLRPRWAAFSHSAPIPSGSSRESGGYGVRPTPATAWRPTTWPPSSCPAVPDRG